MCRGYRDYTFGLGTSNPILSSGQRSLRINFTYVLGNRKVRYQTFCYSKYELILRCVLFEIEMTWVLYYIRFQD